MKKSYIIILISAFIASCIFIGDNIVPVKAGNVSRYENIKLNNSDYKDRAEIAGIKNAQQVEEKYPGNKSNPETLKPLDEMKGYIKDADLKNGAKYISKELLTYEEFINKYANADLNPSISKDRMIRVTVTNYPNGFSTKRGFVENAILTKYYDAETGELFGYGIKSLNKDGNHITGPRPRDTSKPQVPESQKVNDEK